MSTTRRTMKQLAKEALDVQDACNLSGVAIAFGEVMRELGAQPECTGTDWKNRHPIAVMWSSKIASLTGSEDTLTFSHAYDDCKRLAG
jgi:hypothetical protein